MQFISYLYLFTDKIKFGYHLSHIYRQIKVGNLLFNCVYISAHLRHAVILYPILLRHPKSRSHSQSFGGVAWVRDRIFAHLWQHHLQNTWQEWVLHHRHQVNSIS